jgi:shikimate kinase
MEILLSGVACVGKSSVGKRLAEDIGYVFSDGDRMVVAIKGVVGKRLTYRKTVGYSYCLVN